MLADRSFRLAGCSVVPEALGNPVDGGGACGRSRSAGVYGVHPIVAELGGIRTIAPGHRALRLTPSARSHEIAWMRWKISE